MKDGAGDAAGDNAGEPIGDTAGDARPPLLPPPPAPASSESAADGIDRAVHSLSAMSTLREADLKRDIGPSWGIDAPELCERARVRDVLGL